MARYIFRRILESVVLLFIILAINFIILHMAPGDAVSFLVPPGAGVAEEFVENMRHQFGLDRPLGVQFVSFFANALRGNLGHSFYYREPVVRVIVERLPVTFLLVGLATLFSSVGGIGLGVFSASRPYSTVDRIATVVAVLGYSIPVFWFGQILVIVFAVHLKVFPTGGIPIAALGQGGLTDWVRSLVLPVTTLGLIQLALVARITRANMLEVLGSNYIITARAKGVGEYSVTFRHALRNAIMPVVTVIGVNFGYLLTGAMVIETVFSWPGLGRMLLDSLSRRDYPVLMGLLIIMSVGIMVLNLLVDFLYVQLDPRIVYD